MPESNGDRNRGNVYDILMSIANVFAVISVPVGIYVATLLLQLSNDVAVVKAQITQTKNDQAKMELIQTDVNKIRIELQEIKTTINMSYNDRGPQK
jgi:phosphoribosylcarboxyaminoimidazole (NCAIR) mutase